MSQNREGEGLEVGDAVNVDDSAAVAGARGRGGRGVC